MMVSSNCKGRTEDPKDKIQEDKDKIPGSPIPFLVTILIAIILVIRL
jgi:hypothetical protein